MNVSSIETQCRGCGECAALCPHNAIKMVFNQRGELVPNINTANCIDCSVCVDRCAAAHHEASEATIIESFVAKHTDHEIVAASRSGGVFTAISDYILSLGGVVYGCKLVNNTEAVHCRATTQAERDEFRGSKYIQSDISACYKQIKEDLLSGLPVLFSGTACQVAAIKDYCKNVDCSKLFLVDIVCFGVPGNQVWKYYLDFLEKKKKKSITKVSFRNKEKYGWRPHIETVCFSDGSEEDNTIYSTLFGSKFILRENCFNCAYKSLHRPGDITLGDAWKIENVCPAFDDNRGVSLILINDSKGRRLFSMISDALVIKKVDMDDLMQPALTQNYPIPENYQDFWKTLVEKGFEKTMRKFFPDLIKKYSIHNRLLSCGHLLCSVFKRFIKQLLCRVSK